MKINQNILMILYWNEVALEANKVSHTNGLGEQAGPPRSSRALAIVHLAMYDAYVGTATPSSLLHTYLSTTVKTAGLDTNAAIAGAAHATLSFLFPSQIPNFNVALQSAGIDLSIVNVKAGYYYGREVGKQMLANRANDPDSSDNGYIPSVARGAHRPAPDAEKPSFHAPFYGDRSKPFSANQNFTIDPFPAFNDPDFIKSFEQVINKGIKPELSGTVPNTERRTNNETLMGIFWAYDGAFGLGTPPRLYNQIIRQIIIANPWINQEEQASLFALVNVAMADAGIFAWREKYRHNIWRPVVGVREHNASMGPSAVAGANPVNDGDCLWLPFGSPKTNVPSGKNFTPDFPAYPSGHATFGAAAFNMADLYLNYIGKNPFALAGSHLDVVSDELNGVNKDNSGAVRPRHVRRFNSFKEMINENGFSRVYLGVHWSLDAFAVKADGTPDYTKNVGGAMLGIDLAKHIFNRFKSGTDGIDQSTLAPLVP